MDSELEKAYELIQEATCSEDVFGDLTERDYTDKRIHPRDVLKNRYDSLSSTVDPANYRSSMDDKDAAFESKEKLEQFYKIAQARLEEGLYGDKIVPSKGKQHSHISITTNKREYYMGGPIAQGTIATIYEGEMAERDEFSSRVVFKIVDDPKDNDLLVREMRTIQLLRDAKGGQRKHLPFIFDHFKTEDDRMGLIIRRIEGSYDLYTVRENKHHKQGVTSRHMAWMLNRILSVAGYAHQQGIVHGNIEPSHLMVRPRDHNVIMIDWCWSAVKPKQTGDRFLINTEHFSAPEVKDKESPRPASDIYSIAKCMIYALGGDIETDEIPDTVSPEIHRILKLCVLKSPLQRPNDAWELYAYFGNVINELWGKRTFINFPW